MFHPMYISMFVVLSFLLSSPSLFRFFSDHNLGQFLRWSPYPVSTLVITIRSLKTTIFIAKHFLGESTALYIMFEYTSSHHAPGLCCILHFTYLMQSYPHSYHHPHPSHLVYISSLSFLTSLKSYNIESNPSHKANENKNPNTSKKNSKSVYKYKNK